MEPIPTKNGAAKILRTESNSASTKTPINAVSSKSIDFDNLPRKNALYSKDIFENEDFSKILASVQHPEAKFDGKNDGDVPRHVPPTVHEFCPNSVPKCSPDPPKMNKEPPKMVKPTFWRRIVIQRPRKPPFTHFPQNREISINCPENCPYYSKGILEDLYFSKSFPTGSSMETSPGTNDPPFFSYARISCK